MIGALFLLLPLLPASLANPMVEERQIASRQYIISNRCPASINLYIGGQFDATLATGGNTTKDLAETAGLFYTDANGGNITGSGTLRAGFHGSERYYYMVREGNGPLNTGMSVVPERPAEASGFCQGISCNENNCSMAFPSLPTSFPITGSTPPPPPLYQCPYPNTNYRITFCPTGNWPVPLTWRIHPTVVNKCLDVRGGIFANGTAVQIYDCNGSAAQNWVLNRGSTKVQLAGTNFCLDAGATPANGVGMKIWQCFSNLPAQQWFYTDDNRIALEGRGQCLDLTRGLLTNGNQIQSWQCTANAQNQVWVL